MKKIGVLHGKERSFPMAFVERVNGKNISGIMAEPVRIDKAIQGEPTGYAVIIDRISQDIPFYRTWLKNEAYPHDNTRMTPRKTHLVILPIQWIGKAFSTMLVFPLT